MECLSVIVIGFGRNEHLDEPRLAFQQLAPFQQAPQNFPSVRVGTPFQII